MFTLSSIISILITFISVVCYRETPHDNEKNDKATLDTSPSITKADETENYIANSKVSEASQQSDESRNGTKTGNESSENKSKVVTSDEIRSWSSLYQTYYLAKTMPKEIISVWLTSTLGWLSFIAFIMFYTNFVGEAIYHGNPVAPENSTAFANYRRGVRNGSWGIMGYTIVSATYTLLVIRLAKYIGKRL